MIKYKSIYVCSDKDSIRDDTPPSLWKNMVFSNGILDMLDIWNHHLAIRRMGASLKECLRKRFRWQSCQTTRLHGWYRAIWNHFDEVWWFDQNIIHDDIRHREIRNYKIILKFRVWINPSRTINNVGHVGNHQDSYKSLLYISSNYETVGTRNIFCFKNIKWTDIAFISLYCAVVTLKCPQTWGGTLWLHKSRRRLTQAFHVRPGAAARNFPPPTTSRTTSRTTTTSTTAITKTSTTGRTTKTTTKSFSFLNKKRAVLDKHFHSILENFLTQSFSFRSQSFLCQLLKKLSTQFLSCPIRR